MTQTSMQDRVLSNGPPILLYLAIAVLIFYPGFKPGWPVWQPDVLQAVASTTQQVEYIKTYGYLPNWFPHMFMGLPRTGTGLPGLWELILIIPAIFFGPVLGIKLYYIVVYAFEGVNMMLFASWLTKRKQVQILSGIAFMLNPWSVRLIFADPLQAMAFAFFPLVALFSAKAIDHARLDYGIVLGSLLAIITGFNPEYFLVSAILPIVYGFVSIVANEGNSAPASRRKRLLVVCVALSTSLILDLFWIARITSGGFLYGAATRSISDISLWSLSYVGSFSFWQLMPLFEDWFQGQTLFPQTGVVWILITAFAFAGLLLKRDKYTVFLGISALISIYLSLGVNAPLSPWPWLNTLPFLNIIRTPVRFISIAVLSCAYLSSITLDQLASFLGRLARDVPSLGFRRHVLAKLPFTITVVSLLYLASVWPFAMQFATSVGQPPGDLGPVYDIIRQDGSDVRVAGFPVVDHVAHTTSIPFGLGPTALSVLAPQAIDYVFDGKRNFWGPTDVLATKYMQRIAMFLNSAISRNELGDRVGEILGEFNIKYLIVDRTLLDQRTVDYLLHQKSLKVLLSNIDTILFENEAYEPRIFEGRGGLVVGGPGVLSSLATFNNGSENLVLLTPLWPYSTDIIRKSQTVLFGNGEFFDFAMNFINKSLIFEAAKFAHEQSVQYVYRPPYLPYQKERVYGDAVTVLTNSVPLNIRFQMPSSEDATIKLRMLAYPDGGPLSVLVDGRLIAADVSENLTDFSNQWVFRWVTVHTVLEKGDHSLTLFADRGSPIVNSVVVAPDTMLLGAYQQAVEALESHEIMYLMEAEDVFNLRGTQWQRENTLTQGHWHNASNSEFIDTTAPSATVTTTFFAPKSGMYSILIRHLNLDILNSSLEFKVNGYSLRRIESDPDRKEWSWTSVSPIYFSQGIANLSLTNLMGHNAVDELVIQYGFLRDQTPTPSPSWKENSPDSFSVNSTTARDFIVLTESYNPSWKIATDFEGTNGSGNSVLAFWSLNSFYAQQSKGTKIVYTPPWLDIVDDWATLFPISAIICCTLLRIIRKKAMNSGTELRSKE